jgi:alpha-beta hydrolase superfamily lysophospholipase
MAETTTAVTRHEGTITRRRTTGPALHHVTVMPESPRAIVGVLHGYADHSARYSHVMDAWAEAGLGSVALDLRGHGRSGGPRGYCSRFGDYLDDSAELAELVAERAQGLPVFFYGHSFGALTGALSILDAPRPWKGLVVTCPYIGLAMAVPAVKRAAGRIASRVVPRLALPTGLTGAHVTHDPVKAKGYDTDPLVFKKATARWFTETVAAQQRVLERAGGLTLPLLVIVGGADPVAKVSAARAFFEAAGSADKTWDERPGLLHEVLNEPEWRPIADTMSRWMLAH